MPALARALGLGDADALFQRSAVEPRRHRIGERLERDRLLAFGAIPADGG